MTDELKPCPFPSENCHDNRRVTLWPSGKYRGECLCGWIGPQADTPTEAIAAWNRRAGEDEELLNQLRPAFGEGFWAGVSAGHALSPSPDIESEWMESYAYDEFVKRGGVYQEPPE